ncbi:MAG: four helix bundle protein, partial [Calditrichaeota bacterium]
ELQDRLIEFAVQVIRLCSGLPGNVVVKHLSVQLLRSATSPAANYGEARAAESRSDFIHKLRICLKELNESAVWLQMLQRSELVEADKADGLLQECGELQRIIGSSIRTAQERSSNR